MAPRGGEGKAPLFRAVQKLSGLLSGVSFGSAGQGCSGGVTRGRRMSLPSENAEGLPGRRAQCHSERSPPGAGGQRAEREPAVCPGRTECQQQL